MNARIRTVVMNSRGQIVIPEEMRKNKNMTPKEALVLIEKDDEIVLKKESDIVRQILEEDKAWKLLSIDGLKMAWSKEDEIWDKIARKELK